MVPVTVVTTENLKLPNFLTLVSGRRRRRRHHSGVSISAPQTRMRQLLSGFSAPVSGLVAWGRSPAGTFVLCDCQAATKPTKSKPPPRILWGRRRGATRLVRPDLSPTRSVWIIQLKPNFPLKAHQSRKTKETSPAAGA